MSVSIFIQNSVPNTNEDAYAILELNISNTNFHTFWSAMGFTIKSGDLTGKVHPLVLHEKLKTLNPDLVLRSAQPKTNSYFDFGVDEQRVRYYVRKLSEIVAVALKREEFIVWE